MKSNLKRIICVVFIILIIPIPIQKKNNDKDWQAILYKYTRVNRVEENSTTKGWSLSILGRKVQEKLHTYLDDNTYKEINNKITEYVVNHQKELPNYVYHYTDDINKKVIVGLMDIREEKQEEFLQTIFSTEIKKIKDYNLIKYQESIDVFDAKIIESKEDSIIVEVLDNGKSFHKGDKVMMKIERPTNGINDYFVVGNNIRITFNGMVLTSNPAQISVAKIELINRTK